MKTNDETAGLIAGNGTTTMRDICQSMTKKSVSAIVAQKETTVSDADNALHHWSGQPDKDMFFNGWKLLF